MSQRRNIQLQSAAQSAERSGRPIAIWPEDARDSDSGVYLTAATLPRTLGNFDPLAYDVVGHSKPRDRNTPILDRYSDRPGTHAAYCHVTGRVLWFVASDSRVDSELDGGPELDPNWIPDAELGPFKVAPMNSGHESRKVQLESRVAAYIVYLDKQSEIVSDSHLVLHALHVDYGTDAVDAELARQFNAPRS